MLSQIPKLRVTVKDLSTGASIDTVLGTELSETAYSGTIVELNRRAAKAGDVLEIVAHSPNPYVGVRSVPQIVVRAEDVLASRIVLPDLELYEIPSETEMLANYPNPFNPETWIPYRLAKAAEAIVKPNGEFDRDPVSPRLMESIKLRLGILTQMIYRKNFHAHFNRLIRIRYASWFIAGFLITHHVWRTIRSNCLRWRRKGLSDR